MSKSPIDTLREGCRFLDPLMSQHGFSFIDGGSGRGSGGPFASGNYVNADRRLEIHFRFSLGLVAYHFKHLSMDHESYMRAVLGNNFENKYPGFSDDPLAAFRNLEYDLRNFSSAFLEGRWEQFVLGVEIAESARKVPGIARIP